MQEFLDRLLIDGLAFHLAVGAFVPVQPQPFHGFDDFLDGFLRGAGEIRVLDAEDEPAAVVPREQPVEQRRAHAADV